MMHRNESPEQLWARIEWALERGLAPRDLIPMLERLLRSAEPGSALGLEARKYLSLWLLVRSPWRAARLAREVTMQVEDAHAWGLLGLAHTLLGNYRCALKAYRRALSLNPGCPFCHHNLGHLLDVVFERPAEAVRHLRTAHLRLPRETEIATSYAHALARLGEVEAARRLLERAVGADPETASSWIRVWIARSRALASGE